MARRPRRSTGYVAAKIRQNTAKRNGLDDTSFSYIPSDSPYLFINLAIKDEDGEQTWQLQSERDAGSPLYFRVEDKHLPRKYGLILYAESDTQGTTAGVSGFLRITAQSVWNYDKESKEQYGTDPEIGKLLRRLGFKVGGHPYPAQFGQYIKAVTVPFPHPVTPREAATYTSSWEWMPHPEIGEALLQKMDAAAAETVSALEQRFSQLQSGGGALAPQYTVVLTYKGHVLELAPVDTEGEAIQAMQQMQEDIRIKVVEGSTSKGARANRGRVPRRR